MTAYNRFVKLVDEAQIRAAFGSHESWVVEQSDLSELAAVTIDHLVTDTKNLVGPLKPKERAVFLRRPDLDRPGKWSFFAAGTMVAA